MKGKFIIECYNNEEKGWFEVRPVDSKDAIPLLEQLKLAKEKNTNMYKNNFKNIFPYNNSWCTIVEAETVMDAIKIFFEIYRSEVYSKV